MAASNEWDEWHLTPTGWVQGTEKTDFAYKEVDPPVDRVATYIYQEYVGSVHSGTHISWEEIWVKPGAALAEIKEQFGSYPTKFVEDRVLGRPIKFSG